MSYIFISYSRSDLEVAGRIVQALEASRLDTWIDWKSIPGGENWEPEVYRGIEEADAFLFLISAASVRSEMCNKEIAHAVRNGKRILPLFIADVDEGGIYPILDQFLHREQREEICRRNFLKCRPGRDAFDRAIEAACRTIHTNYEWLRYHTRLQVKALEWERTRDHSRLLRGKELREGEQWLARISPQEDPQPTALQREYVFTSRRNEERQRRQVTLALSLGLLVLAFLSVFAWQQRNEAVASKNAAVVEANARGTAQSEAEQKEQARATAQAIAEQKARVSRANELAILSQGMDGRFPQLRILLGVESLKATSLEADPPVPSAEQAVRDVLNDVKGIGLSPSGRTAAFSPDDRRLAIADRNGDIHFYDRQADTFSLRSTLETGSAIKDIYFSPDDAWLLLRDESGYSLWQRTAGALDRYRQVKEQSNIREVEIAGNSQWLAAINDHTLFIYNLKTFTGNPVKLQWSGKKLEEFAISPDGQWIVIGTSDGSLGVLNLPEAGPGDEPAWLKVEDTPIHGVLASEDWLISGADKNVKVWRIEADGSLTLLHTILPAIPENDTDFSRLQISGNYLLYGEGFQRYLLDLNAADQPPAVVSAGAGVYRISSTGKWLVSTVQGGTLTGIIPSFSARPLRNYPEMSAYTIVGDEGSQNNFIFSHDDRWLVTTGSSGVRLWDLSLWPDYSDSRPCSDDHFLHDGDALVLRRCPDLGWGAQLPGAEFSADGNWLAIASGSQIKLWPTTSLPTSEPEITLEHDNKISALALSSDNQWLASGDVDGNLRLWSDPYQSPEPAQPVVLPGHPSQLTLIEFSPDHRWLLTVSEETAFLWELSTPERAAPIAIQGHAQIGEGDFEFSSDGHWLAISAYKKDPVLYDLTSKEPAAARLTVHGQPVSAVDELFFSPDGQWILGFDRDPQRVRAWKLEKKGPVFKQTRLDELAAIQALFFSGDGDYLVTGDKSSYQVWSFSDLVKEDLPSVRPVFEGESQGALPDQLTADRRWLIFNDLSLVDLQTSKGSRLISGPTHLLLDTAVSNDTRKILVASDMTSSLWYLDHLELPPVALWSRGSLMSSYFSPNGDWLVIPGPTIYIQYLDKNALIERACQVAGRNLTPSEWQRFFAGEEYRLTCPQWPAPVVE